VRVAIIKTVALAIYAIFLCVYMFGSERLKENVVVMSWVIIMSIVLGALIFIILESSEQRERDLELQREAWRVQIRMSEKWDSKEGK